jgi:outer membrane immunogenic protein
MTRRLLAGVAFAAFAATSALASDMPPPRYMPPPRAPAFVPFFSWNGAYVGFNAGYGFGKSNWTSSAAGLSTGNFNVSGAVVGGTLGYNVQLGSAVFGIETDLDWSNIHGSTTTTCLGTCKTSNNYLGTLRGRIGYAFDRFMPYVTGGMAYGDVRATMVGVVGFNSTNIGWTGGGGLEYAFMNNWSAKLEYLYVDLGKATCDASCSGGTPIDAKFNTNIVRAGINYKF